MSKNYDESNSPLGVEKGESIQCIALADEEDGVRREVQLGIAKSGTYWINFQAWWPGGDRPSRLTFCLSERGAEMLTQLMFEAHWRKQKGTVV